MKRREREITCPECRNIMLVDVAFLEYDLYECHGCGEILDLTTQRATWFLASLALAALAVVVLG